MICHKTQPNQIQLMATNISNLNPYLVIIFNKLPQVDIKLKKLIQFKYKHNITRFQQLMHWL